MLIEAKLYDKSYKCDLLKEKTDYLDFEISSEGIHASSENFNAVFECPLPQSISDIILLLA